MPTFIKRILIGFMTGISIGSIVLGIEFALDRDAGRLPMTDLAGVALLLGSSMGVPVGVIVAMASPMAAYRSGWAWEWALVGASGAALTIVASGRIQTPAGWGLLVIATATSVVVERATALLFHDQPYDDAITHETLMVYLVTIGLIVASYFALLQGLLLWVD